MSMKASIISESDLAKTLVLNSSLDDDVKKNLALLISKSAHATNGISQEEKIQSLTECMLSLASTLAIYMSKSDDRLNKLEDKYLTDHPPTRMEKLQKFEQTLSETEKFRNMNGIIPNIKISGECIEDIINGSKQYIDKKIDCDDASIVNKIFKLLEKPYVWMFGTVAVCSPFAVDIINTVINAFMK